MMRRPILMTMMAPLIAVSACNGCPETDLIAARRTIAIDVCKTPDVEPKGGVEDCSVDFGIQTLTVPGTTEIIISNVGEDDIEIHGARLSDTSDPAFIVEHYPDVLKAGVSSTMVVTFRPMLTSQVTADVILDTTAENALANGHDGEVVIHLTGGGVDDGLPNLKVEVVRGDDLSACCDLGLVPVGTAANCLVKLTNTGVRDLVLDEVGFVSSETTGDWQAVGAQPNPNTHVDDERFTIPSNEYKTLSFKFTPADLLERTAQVFIRTNAPRACGPAGVFSGNECNAMGWEEPCDSGKTGEVQVNMRGQGAEPPTCVAKIKSVNGSSAFDPRLIEPLDDVELSAEDSNTSVPGLTITGYKWSIKRRPPGSNVRFDSDTSPSPRFAFDNTSTNIITGLDVAGEYEVRCEVTDSRGTTSVNDAEATLTIVATPSEAIHFQLVWDAPETDVDLHMIRERPAGQFNYASEDDCYYANCKPSTDGPIWDESNAAHEGGNPKLDVDDVQGYGPENSNVDEPLPGRYKALVHYFSDHGNGDTVATLRVYVYGNLVAEYNKLIQDGDEWDVGVVEWPAQGAATWTEINVVGN